MEPESQPEVSEDERPDLPPDASITRDLFLQWRSPREGSVNPEELSNPVWTWLVRSRWNAWRATRHFDGPSAMEAGPGWCFDRFGQSVTVLPDGREVWIAGEHEDYYDPDFYIYNDVVVRHPDGRIQILAYPRAVFPPTDFHSATRVGNRIVIIGNLGYPADRRPRQTPVFALDLETWAISQMTTSGTPPGWISEHQARLNADESGILISGGKLDRGSPAESLLENLDDWCLHLADGRWERLTARNWPRWEARRVDGRRLHLWEFQQALWERRFPEFAQTSPELEGIELPTLEQELGGPPELDLFPRLFLPEVPHEPIPSDSEADFRTHRIRVQGVVVRFVEGDHGVQVTVEGSLADSVHHALLEDLQLKLERLERQSCCVKVLGSD